MKLIDADLLIESIQATLNMGRESFPACLFCEVIDEQPTVFDTDRIAEQLKENAFMVATSKEFYSNPQNGEHVEEVIKLEEAIKIVEGGGAG